jgi:hypothetical protein
MGDQHHDVPIESQTDEVRKDASVDQQAEKESDDLPPSLQAAKKDLKQPKGRFQERISELVAQRNAIEKENAILRAKLAELSTPSKSPTEANSYDEYIKSLVDQQVAKAIEERTATALQQQRAAYRQERLTRFQQEAEKVAQAHGAGFWDMITDPTLPISESVADAVFELDANGPLVMLYLSTHRDEAARISALPPARASVEIGKLASKLELEKSSPTKNLQVQIPRGGVSRDSQPSDEDDVETWLRKESARIRSMYPNARFYGR